MDSQLIGHEQIQSLLDRAVEDGRLHHAYLLHGMPSVGKSSLARWLALRLNCQEPNAPCRACRTCRRILSGTYPDVRSLQPPSDRDPNIGLLLDSRDDSQRSSKSASRIISVDDVRALQRDAALAPNEALKKVYIVVGAESMPQEAANCLLKTLEEPPPHVILILTTVDPYDLLPTIVSRCQSIRLGGVPMAAIANALRQRGVAGDEADLLARLAGGRPGWAVRAVTSPDVMTERAQAFEYLRTASDRAFRERLGVAERIAQGYSQDPQAVLHTLALWELWWWDVSLLQDGCADLVTNVDQRALLQAAASAIPRSRLRAYVQRISATSQRLLQNVNPRLALEALVVAAPVLT